MVSNSLIVLWMYQFAVFKAAALQLSNCRRSKGSVWVNLTNYTSSIQSNWTYSKQLCIYLGKLPVWLAIISCNLVSGSLLSVRVIKSHIGLSQRDVFKAANVQQCSCIMAVKLHSCSRRVCQDKFVFRSRYSPGGTQGANSTDITVALCSWHF